MLSASSGDVEALGEVEELVATEAAQGVRGAGDRLEAVRDGHQQLVADEVAVGVVDALEVVQVQQEERRRARPGARSSARAWDESVLEQRPVGQSGERVVQGLVARVGR